MTNSYSGEHIYIYSGYVIKMSKQIQYKDVSYSGTTSIESWYFLCCLLLSSVILVLEFYPCFFYHFGALIWALLVTFRIFVMFGKKIRCISFLVDLIGYSYVVVYCIIPVNPLSKGYMVL